MCIRDSVKSDTPITNVAKVTSDIYDPDPENSEAKVTINVPSAADLEIEKTADKETANYLDTVKFTVRVKNRGPDKATGVKVEDKLEEGLEFVEATATKGNYDPESGIWTVGDLAAGEEATLEIVAKVVESNTTITNVAKVTSDIYDPEPEDNEAEVTITVPPAADLEIEKTADKETVNYLDTVKFTVRVKNLGPDKATGVEVEDKLEEGLEFVGATATKGNYDPESGIWTIGDLAADEEATLEIVAKVVKSNTPITNVAKVTSDAYDPGAGNNEAEVTINVPSAADLEIEKTADKETVNSLTQSSAP